MQKLGIKVLKNAAIMFAVGCAVALSLPALALVVDSSLVDLGFDAAKGYAEAATAMGTEVPLRTGLFFSAFGGLHAAIDSMVNGYLGAPEDERAASQPAPRCAQQVSKEHAITTEPELIQHSQPTSSFAANLDKQRSERSSGRVV